MNRADLVKQRKRRELRVQRSLVQSASVMRSVDYTKPSRAVIATETPIPKYDEQTDQVVREVLLMSGAEFRSGRNQIPIVDSHDDRTVRNIFGSIQNIRIDHASGEMYGTPVFASDPESQSIATRMNEGHITDFSITAIPTETIFVARGQSYTTDRGELIEGPALVHTKWTPLNASICATGADENSTVRRSYTDLNRKVSRMDEALLAELSAMGLPEGMTDPNQVLSWVVGKMKEDDSPEIEPVVESMVGQEPAMPEDPKPEVVENMDGEKKPEDAMVARKLVVDEIRRALDADKKRRKEIQAACTLAKVERAIADQWCDAGISVSEARKRIIERMATQPLGTSVGSDVRVTESEADKVAAAMSSGLVQRAYKNARLKAKPETAPGAEDFANFNLRRMASYCVERMGLRTDRMTDAEIARVAMGSPGAINKYRIQRDAYHTTGSFPNLLLDAANKTLRQAYEEASYTWSLWARQAPSVEDFKNINRIALGESPNLEMVPEAKEYPEKSIGDQKTSYKVEKYGAIFTISWETVINDDLDAISRIPAMHGNAARRSQNKAVYDVLFANPTMTDGQALFSASHASGRNINSAAAGVPSVTTLDEAFQFMMLQKGQSSDTIINVTPSYLIVPAKMSGTALQLVNSQSYAQTGGNEGVVNIYGVNGVRPLTVVVEPLLDGNDPDGWYLAADPAQIDTVELSFLSGEESPVLESDLHFETDTYRYKVRQTFGCAAIDWRGLYRNT